MNEKANDLSYYAENTIAELGDLQNLLNLVNDDMEDNAPLTGRGSLYQSSIYILIHEVSRIRQELTGAVEAFQQAKQAG